MDAVSTGELHSGQEAARIHRRALNKEIAGLLEQTQALYQQLNDIILTKVNKMVLGLASGGSDVAAGEISPSSGDDAPLTREEAAKLLLLVSKAGQAGYIGEVQKAYVLKHLM